MRGRKKRKKDKREALIIHFQRRCMQRVGKILSSKEITSKIQKGELEFLERQSIRVSAFKYTHEGEDYKIVYDMERKAPITILYSEEVWQKKQAQLLT